MFSYCPLQIWALKTCNQDISEIIIASSFKQGQLVEDDESITRWKKVILFLVMSFVNLDIENFIKYTCISKHFIASSFKLYQLITGCYYYFFYFSSN